MKPFLSRRRLPARSLTTLLIVSIVILLMPSAASKAEMKSASVADEFKVTTVFLIRHAEKADAPREDPPLNELGKTRALLLARMLGGSGIKAVYTSQFLRTQQTGEPLAKQLGLTALPISLKMKPSNPREVSEQSIAEITNKIYERAGDTALVIGHSNTVPEVIRMLGGDVVPVIDEKKFDDLFIVTVYAKGKARVVQMKYGGSN